ncbi:MAG: hypothetical protein Q9177_001313 [Variospora cf. flavescens]
MDESHGPSTPTNQRFLTFDLTPPSATSKLATLAPLAYLREPLNLSPIRKRARLPFNDPRQLKALRLDPPHLANDSTVFSYHTRVMNSPTLRQSRQKLRVTYPFDAPLEKLQVTEATTSEPTSSTPPQPVTDSSLETASKSFPHLKASTPTGLKSNTSLEPTSDGPKRKQLTRDQRLQIHTLRKAGHTYDFIVNFFKPDKVTFRQVAYAATQPIEPQNHRCGAKPKLDVATRRHIKDLMDKSAGPRPITYKEVSAQLGLGVSQSTLRRARM